MHIKGIYAECKIQQKALELRRCATLVQCTADKWWVGRSVARLEYVIVF